jgi:hypothetical protein
MKTVKLLIIAVVAVAAIIGISQLLNSGGGGTDVIPPSGDRSIFNEISQSIEQLEKSVWNKDLYSKTYRPIADRIKANRNNKNISESEERTLADKAELACIDILIKGVAAEISTCNQETMKQLKRELDEFADIGTHDGVAGFKQTVRNMTDYKETQDFIYSLYALKTKKADLETKFPDAKYYHTRAEALKENSFVTRCSRLQTSLDNADKELCEAHYLFLAKKTDLFIRSDFSALSSTEEVNKKFDGIENEFSDFLSFAKYPFYPSASKKKIDSAMKKLEDRKKEVIATLK